MVFPLEQLVTFNGNIYEITVAASLRAYQMAKVNDPEIAANQDKVVCHNSSFLSDSFSLSFS